MNVRRIYIDLVFFSIFFALFFSIFFMIVDRLVSFWMFLELCGLSIVPCFFFVGDSYMYGVYKSLFTYIVASGISSILIVSGILFVELYMLVVFGFLLKLGTFPFSLWVYRVFSGSKWYFIFCLSVILKFPVLFFCFIFHEVNKFIIYISCSLTMLMCALLFWGFSCDWKFVWCHISLSSVSTLLIACYSSRISLCGFIYAYYFFWGVLCCWYFKSVGEGKGVFGKFWFFCFTLLVTPFSFPLFYKLSTCVAIFNSSFYVLRVWCLYKVFEQFYLYKLASNCFYSRFYNLWVF